MAPEIARAYIRLSRLREGEEKLSPDIQMDLARSVCISRKWEFDEESSKECSDLDVSGFSIGWEDRPGLYKHFLDAKEGRYSRLLVSAIDRLGRNAADSIQCWDQFEGLGIKLFSIRESIDTDSAAGILIRNIMASVAEMESRNASARIKANVEKRASMGKLHGGRLPFWLRRNENREIVLRDDEAALLRQAVAMRLAGHSYVQITRAINAAGYRTINSGKPYERSFIVKILQKTDWIETMMGHAYTRRQGRYTTDPRTSRRVSRGTPIKIENAYPALIDEETGYQLMALRNESVRIEPDNDGVIRRNRVSEKWMLNGILRCKICGSRMGVHSRRLPERMRRTYICESNNAHPKGDHARSLVDADMIEMAVILGLAGQIRLLLAQPSAEVRPPSKTRSINDIDEELERIVGLYGRGSISAEILDRQAERLSAEREQLVRHEILTKAKQARPQPILQNGVKLQEIRELIKYMEVQIRYPIFLDGVYQPPQSKSQERKLKPCVELLFPEGGDPEDVIYPEYKLFVPLFRMEYRGPRRLFVSPYFEGINDNLHSTEADISLARSILGR